MLGSLCDSSLVIFSQGLPRAMTYISGSGIILVMPDGLNMLIMWLCGYVYLCYLMWNMLLLELTRICYLFLLITCCYYCSFPY